MEKGFKKKVNKNPDKRKFNRFPLEFELEVSARGKKRETHVEKTTLRDISGGGAKFITRHAEKYFPGQSLEMVIYLPRAGGVTASMRGKATVVRIEASSNSGVGEKSRGIGDSVNVAARLEHIAKGGEILIGEETYRQNQGRFSMRKKGKVHIENRVQPVICYYVVR